MCGVLGAPACGTACLGLAESVEAELIKTRDALRPTLAEVSCSSVQPLSKTGGSCSVTALFKTAHIAS